MDLLRPSRVIGMVVLAGCMVLEAHGAGKGYTTRLFLDAPIPIGPGQTLTGGGAPEPPGIFVELWRLREGQAAESVASVPAGAGGAFTFEGVDVEPGDSYYVTLSRSWQFRTDGDFEGWNQSVSADLILEVRGGVLRVTVQDGNRDGFYDPFFHNFFQYDPYHYRVVEVRLRNPVDVAPSLLGVFFGSPWASTKFVHNAEVPPAMSEFETILIPMNVDETQIQPAPVQRGVDGLWARGALNDVLRLDPLNGLPRFVEGIAGAVFEIDLIRIREDYRLEFEIDGDFAGIDGIRDMTDLVVSQGFLSYTVLEQPYFLSGLLTGKLEAAHFTRFVAGLEGSSLLRDPGEIAVSFADADSAATYLDDGGTVQQAVFPVRFGGRQDVVFELDAFTSPAGEWSEDGRVPIQGLAVHCPILGTSGDLVRLDYVGFVAAEPYGPSASTFVPWPNHPPVAVLLTDPSPPALKLLHESVAVTLDGSRSDDGDDGTQELSYCWEKLSGPAGDVITAPESAVTDVVFASAGDYAYRLTVDDGQPVDSHASAEVTVSVLEPVFLRGDADSDGTSMEMGDVLLLLKVLFTRAGEGVSCLDAMDVDDDGALGISDALVMLAFHCGRVETAAQGFSSCGPDLTEDSLRGCEYPEELCATAAHWESAGTKRPLTSKTRRAGGSRRGR